MRDYIKEYNTWLNYNNLDKEIITELKLIKDQNIEIEDRFHKDLEFGTGGLRGVIGAGTNRMNIYTIRKITLALANYILSQGTQAMNKGVAIAYDSRKYSKEFAEESAKVLAANNIKVYLFSELRPLPLLSFAVRDLCTYAGIVITASHNPAEYNGYKIYNDKGSQITEAIAEMIHMEINKINNSLDIKVIDLEEALKNGRVKMISDEIDDRYIECVKTLLLHKNFIINYGKNLKVVYTPLHGAGNKLVSQVLDRIGFKNLYIVKEQEAPDPKFPTVKTPNPENIEVFDLAIKLGKNIDADIIMATDPDADRIGLLVNVEGDYQALNGNQLGVLILNYLLSEKTAQGTLSNDSIVIKTIVTSDLGRIIANKYAIKTEDTLTGFKYIGEKINSYEINKMKKFLFGYEESLGYLVGDFVRDKDAAQIATIIVEMAIFYKQSGYTLFNILEKIYQEYGYYAEELISIRLKGIEGKKRINDILTTFRQETPKEINGIKIEFVEDYLIQKRIEKKNNKETLLTLPKSNVLKLIFEDNSWVAIRPSGTEPKIKIYFSANADSQNKVNEKLNGMKKVIIDIVNLVE